MVVGDLDDHRAHRTAVGDLQPAQQLDVGARVHDGVGDEFADDQDGVLGEALADDLGAGQGQFPQSASVSRTMRRAAPGASGVPGSAARAMAS